MIVKYLDLSDLKELQKAFIDLDTNKSGSLTFQELKEGLEIVGIGVATETVEEILQNIDLRGSGEVSYHDFLAATFMSKHELSEAMMWQAFKFFDRDNSGVISIENILEVLEMAGKTMSDPELTALLKECGLLDSDFLSFESFKLMLKVL